jgi:hypothetical protein
MTNAAFALLIAFDLMISAHRYLDGNALTRKAVRGSRTGAVRGWRNRADRHPDRPRHAVVPNARKGVSGRYELGATDGLS